MNDKTRPRPIPPQDFYSAQEVMNLLRISVFVDVLITGLVTSVF